MPVRITCRGTKISEELHDMIDRKSRRLSRFFEKVDAIDVILTGEKHRRRCELNVHAGHFNLAAHSECSDEGAAFEKALKAMQRQIVENKSKMIEKKQKSVNIAKQTTRSGKPIRVAIPADAQAI